MSAKILIDALCDLVYYERIDHIPKALECMGLTVKDARDILSTENPRLMTNAYVDKLTAEMALLHADFIAIENARCLRPRSPKIQ